MNDHSLSTLKQSHDELIRTMRASFTREIEHLQASHEHELNDEKDATRRALDAVQRAHDAELKEQISKMRASITNAQQTTTESRNECDMQTSKLKYENIRFIILIYHFQSNARTDES